MKLRNWRNRRDPRLMVIPMIDIIFFLLVFFMLNTLYMVEQNVFPVQLPKAQHADQQPTQQVAVTVSKEGEIWINQHKIDPKQFDALIRKEMSANPEAVFILRADNLVPYGQVVEVMDQLKSIGVKKVSIATERGN